MRCVLCGTPLRDMILQCDCGGRLGEAHIPFNPNDVPVVPFGRVEDCLPPNDFTVVSPKLVERLERTADQMARMRREQRARRRRIDFQVIAGGRQRD